MHATSTEVFDFIADYRNIPRLQPHFSHVKLDGELERGVGAKVALEGRFHGIPLHAHSRIIAYDAPHRMVSITEGAVLSRSTWELQQVSTDPPLTRVTLTLDYKLESALGGLFRGVGSSLWPLFHKELHGMTNESLKRLHSAFGGKV